jgi:hypothetical protein
MDKIQITPKTKLLSALLRAILYSAASTLPFWLWDPRHFSKPPHLYTPLSFFLLVVILSLIGLASQNPLQWIWNVFKSVAVFFGLIVLGVVLGLLFIRDTYGFLAGGVAGLILGAVGIPVYWLVKFFKKAPARETKSEKE